MTTNSAIGTDISEVVEAYLDEVSRRGREPMEPQGFQPNWADQPSRHTTFVSADRIALPRQQKFTGPDASTVLATLRTSTAKDAQRWTLGALAHVLRHAYAPLNRRLRITWNQDTAVRELFPEAVWGRGSASGGGMYPLEIYLVTDGRFSGLLPGRYHYATAHHAFEPLESGDLASTVGAASGSESGTYLVVTTRFWKNSFKYNSFAYHVVTQDLGALLYSAQLMAASIGRSLSPRLPEDDRSINDAFGVDPMEETCLAVIPIETEGPAPEHLPAPSGESSLHRFERSSVVRRFETVDRVQQAMLQAQPHNADGLPAPSAHGSGSSEPRKDAIALPAAPRSGLHRNVTDLLRHRRSCFGAFSGHAPLTLAEVSTALNQGATCAENVLPGTNVLPQLSLFAHRVDGLASGAYEFDVSKNQLVPVVQQPGMDVFLQRNYFLTNYNLREAAAVVAISMDWAAIRDHFGVRGYRIANCIAAAAGQAINIASTDQSVASGIVLGFDNISFNELLGEEQGRTFLFVILGHEGSRPAEYSYDLA